MDSEKLEKKILETQEKMEDLKTDSEEYAKLSKILKEDQATLSAFEAAYIDYMVKESQIRIEQEKFEAEKEANQQKIDQAKKDRRKEIIKVLINGSLTLGAILLTVNAEGTRILTSKALSLAFKTVPVPKV